MSIRLGILFPKRHYTANRGPAYYWSSVAESIASLCKGLFHLKHMEFADAE